MSSNIEVIPAIIPRDLNQLKEEIGLVSSCCDTVQIDIMDGKYAPEPTWPYVGEEDDFFNKIKSQDDGLPGWETLNFEVDLMVSNPEEVWKEWFSVGVNRIIIHFESTDNFENILESIRKVGGEKGSPFYTEVGCAIKPSTPNEKIYYLLDKLDFVQFMGNDKIGFHGVSLDQSVLGKVKDLRDKKTDLPIAVDIGVNFDTAKSLLDSGVTKLISGSAILKSDSPRDAILRFKQLG